ncbi:hypothetical protein BR93DRAFT_964421 [Coniochaeta sp. PMI_546]|nr:hypothetical protein BR93DRAFT_964421 [Coniochaeta sp. PMI_546]
MATRVYVTCLSELIPGNATERRTTMANIICEFQFKRDFDKSHDSLQSFGQYAVDGSRCHLLVDVGPPGADEYDLYWYHWDGKQLIERTVTPPLIWHMKKYYPFNPMPKPLLSDNDLKVRLGEDGYKKIISSRIEQKRKYGIDLSQEDKQFLGEYPNMTCEVGRRR